MCCGSRSSRVTRCAPFDPPFCCATVAGMATRQNRRNGREPLAWNFIVRILGAFRDGAQITDVPPASRKLLRIQMHFRVSEVYLALAAEFVKVAGSPAVHREFWHASNRQQTKLCLSVGVNIGFVRGLAQVFSWATTLLRHGTRLGHYRTGEKRTFLQPNVYRRIFAQSARACTAVEYRRMAITGISGVYVVETPIVSTVSTLCKSSHITIIIAFHVHNRWRHP